MLEFKTLEVDGMELSEHMFHQSKGIIRRLGERGTSKYTWVGAQVGD